MQVLNILNCIKYSFYIIDKLFRPLIEFAVPEETKGQPESAAESGKVRQGVNTSKERPWFDGDPIKAHGSKIRCA